MSNLYSYFSILVYNLKFVWNSYEVEYWRIKKKLPAFCLSYINYYIFNLMFSYVYISPTDSWSALPCGTSVQYCGECPVLWGIPYSTLEGVQYCGGYNIQYCGGCSVLWGIPSSTLENIQRCGGKSQELFEYYPKLRRSSIWKINRDNLWKWKWPK